jgi:hypothetical protein
MVTPVPCSDANRLTLKKPDKIIAFLAPTIEKIGAVVLNLCLYNQLLPPIDNPPACRVVLYDLTHKKIKTDAALLALLLANLPFYACFNNFCVPFVPSLPLTKVTALPLEPP